MTRLAEYQLHPEPHLIGNSGKIDPPPPLKQAINRKL